MKYDWKFKLECIEKYRKREYINLPENCKSTRTCFMSHVRDWNHIYDLYGLDGLKHKNQNTEWTAEQKYELVAKVLAGRSNRSVAVEAGINDGQLYQWVRRYKQNGLDGLQCRKRGRKTIGEIMQPSKKVTLEIEQSEKEELIRLKEEVEYLKTEVAYLKKLRALIVQKQAESSTKAKKQKSSKNSEKMDTN